MQKFYDLKALLLTLDITSLYTNIPHEGGLETSWSWATYFGPCSICHKIIIVLLSLSTGVWYEHVCAPNYGALFKYAYVILVSASPMTCARHEEPVVEMSCPSAWIKNANDLQLKKSRSKLLQSIHNIK